MTPIWSRWWHFRGLWGFLFGLLLWFVFFLSSPFRVDLIEENLVYKKFVVQKLEHMSFEDVQFKSRDPTYLSVKFVFKKVIIHEFERKYDGREKKSVDGHLCQNYELVTCVLSDHFVDVD